MLSRMKATCISILFLLSLQRADRIVSFRSYCATPLPFLHLVPVVSLPMDEIQGSTLMGSINGNLLSSASIVPGKVGGALFTNGVNQRVNYGNHRTQCYHQPDMCTGGVTFSLWLKIMSSAESVILDCGGFHASAIGYAMRRQSSGRFRVAVIDRTHMDKTDILQWKLDEWAHLVMTYDLSAGVLLYMNGCQLGLQQPRETRSTPVSFLPDFFIGGASYISTMNAKMEMDNMLIWHQALNGEEVWQLYMQGGMVI